MKKTEIDNVGKISLTHGFRKFVNTEMINSDVNLVVKEMLLGDSVGLAGSYYRPATDKLLDEYLKVVNNLTINEENRLKIKVKQLETDKVRRKRNKAIIEGMTYDEYRKGKHHDIVL
jgi:hypothetical protein